MRSRLLFALAALLAISVCLSVCAGCVGARIALAGAQAALEPLQFYIVGPDGQPAKAETTWGANSKFFAGYGKLDLILQAVAPIAEGAPPTVFWEYRLQQDTGAVAFELVVSTDENDPWVQVIPTTYERARTSLKLLPPLPESETVPTLAAAGTSAPKPSGQVRIYP